jgi:hypothetical protein
MEDITEGYVRVSDILSIFQSYAHVPRAQLKKAQDIGTDIHAAIEAFYKDEFTPLDKKKNPYFESFLKWNDRLLPEPVLIEKRLYGEELMITGRIDLLVQSGGKSVIVDFKTGSWAHPEIWRLQGAFYRYLVATSGIAFPDVFIFVQLQKDGSYPNIHEFIYRDRDWNVCLSALECYKFFKNVPVDLNSLLI